MPTPVSLARPCLSPGAAAALSAAVAAARRRSHAQTTSLHFIASLLSSPLLQSALSRSRSHSYSPRLQLKALELCFSVALDRLPSSPAGAGGGGGGGSSGEAAEEPPVSNSLMAAIKRSQANQRRNPETFHLYQQNNASDSTINNNCASSSCSSSSSFSGVKVELQQLILAILDDPVVSRVFGEAGFRSTDIKLAILRPAPPQMLRFPRKCAPLFLCSFSNGSDELIGSVSGSGEEHCRRIGEILQRDLGHGKNPMLVGPGAQNAAHEFCFAVQSKNWAVIPRELEGIKIVNIGLMDGERIEERIEEVVSGERLGLGLGLGFGVVMSVGDLSGLVEGEEAGKLVGEITRVLEVKRGFRVWVLGWTVNYETYMKFLSRYPLLDKDWELQLLPITCSAISRSGGNNNGGASNDNSINKSHNFVPFGGFFQENFEPVNLVPVQYQSNTRCQSCNYKYEQEALTIMKASSVDHIDQVHPNFPSWIPKSADPSKVSDESKLVLSGKIANLQKKWTEYCHRLHTSYSIQENNFPLFPHFIPLQNPPLNPKPVRPVQSISLPSNPNQNLISRLTPRDSKSEQINQISQLNQCENERNESPCSVNTVTTDLALATPRGPAQNSPNPNFSSSQNLDSFDSTSYKTFIADLFKRVGRQEEALRIISQVIVSSRSHQNPNPNPNPNRSSKKGIWLGFKGGDLIAQRRTATALAEMVSGGKETLISVDLGRESFNLRGKTSIDFIAGEITKMPSAVVYIENVDKADVRVRESLIHAIQTGRLRNSHGREIGIDGRIFLLAWRGKKGIFPPKKEYSRFNEENILLARGRKMKIIECDKICIGNVSSGKVVISRKVETAKRKNDVSYGSPKRPNLGLDLNLPMEEPSESESENNDNNNDNDSLSDEENENLFQQIDVAEFRDFNFDVLAEEVLKEINKVFREKFGSQNCDLEIESKAMEQILASAWMVEERETIYKWVEMVLGASFGDLKQRSSRFLCQFKLVVCEEDLLIEGENWSGANLLPCRIMVG